MPFTFVIGGDDLERRGDLVLGGPAADIEEVRRAFPIELDDVHRGHGKPGAIDHAADRALERDIVKIVLGGLDLLGVLLALVAQRGDVGVAVKRIVVERHFGVEDAQLAVRQYDQRVYLQHRHVFRQEGGVELGDKALRLLGEIIRKLECAGRGAPVMRHNPGRRIDAEAVDLFRRIVSNILDVDPALSREDEGHSARLPVDQRRKIELPVNRGAVLDVQAIDLLAVRRRSRRHQRRPEHLRCESLDLFDRASEPHAAFVPAAGSLKRPLPRPPAWIWLFTTQIGPASFWRLQASSGVKAGKPEAIGTPNALSTALA